MQCPLRERPRQRRPRHPAFTLIELLLVLAILVILMGLVGTRILGSQKKANINAAKVQLGLFENALEHYALDMRTFPTTEDGLEALIERPADSDDSDNWNGSYLKGTEIPKDPWGNEFQYEFSPSDSDNEDSPHIWSLGPDREEGTDDDIRNWSEEGDDDEGPSPSVSVEE